MIIGFLFWLGFAATIVLAEQQELFLLSLISFAGFVGTIVYIMFFISCPRCKAPLGNASMIYGKPFSRKISLNYCPNCGVDLNDEM